MRLNRQLGTGLAIVAMLTMAHTGFASGILDAQLAQLNQTIKNLFAPSNNNLQKLLVNFKQIEMNDLRATAVNAQGKMSVKGKVNNLGLTLGVNYKNVAGDQPTTRFSGALKIDLIKAFGQDLINQVGGGLEEFINEGAKGLLKDYGDAVTVNTAISEKNVDPQGNLTRMVVTFSAKIDMSKLPATVKPSDVPALSLAAKATIDTMGMALSGSVVSNPLYSSFQSDQTGLKETLTKLLNGDEGAIKNNIIDDMKGILGEAIRIADEDHTNDHS